MERLNKEDYLINNSTNTIKNENSLGNDSGSKIIKNRKKNRGCLPSSKSINSDLNFTNNKSIITDNEYEVTSEINSEIVDDDIITNNNSTTNSRGIELI